MFYRSALLLIIFFSLATEGVFADDRSTKEPIVKYFNTEREAITVNPLGPPGGTSNPNFAPLPPYFSGLEGPGSLHNVDGPGK